MGGAIKLLIADDRPVIREGLKRIVSDCPDMTVVGAAANREELLEAVRARRPDVVLLDIAMAGPSALAIIRELTRRRAELRVLVLNITGEDRDAVRVLKSGALGYLSKEHSPDELLDAIRRVARGTRYVSAGLAGELVSDLARRGERPPHETLSEREYEVLCMFGSGKAFNRIAAALGVSPKTVNTYRTRILHKLNLHSNAEMMRYAIENHLAD